MSDLTYSERMESERLRRKQQEQKESSGDALLSGAVAYATDSAILGTLVGGDIGGAIIGDILNGGDLFD